MKNSTSITSEFLYVLTKLDCKELGSLYRILKEIEIAEDLQQFNNGAGEKE